MKKIEGILLINKEKNRSSFSLVSQLRKRTQERTIGHGGTLDPFAEGVMVLFIGKNFTRLSSKFLESDKEYDAKIFLGASSNTFDSTGEIVFSSSIVVPTENQVQMVLARYQGNLLQIPPMFSAKKIRGKKLYLLARQGKEIDRPPHPIFLKTELIRYQYPYLDLHFICSKGTYVRSLAHEIGKELLTGAYLDSLTRTRSGPFHLHECLDEKLIYDESFNFLPFLKHQWTSSEALIKPNR